jgi:hypothetical protein
MDVNDIENVPPPQFDNSDLVSEWSVPTQDKSPGAGAVPGDDKSQPPPQPQSAQFDSSIPEEPAPWAEDPPPTPEENKSLERISKFAVIIFEWLLVQGTVKGMMHTAFNKHDRLALLDLQRLAAARNVERMSVMTEYEEWILNQKTQIDFFEQKQAPFSEDEVASLVEASQPVIKKQMDRMKLQASPELVLALAIGMVATPRVGPLVMMMAGTGVFANNKPTYERATDVT